jgi:hypothetical protein
LLQEYADLRGRPAGAVEDLTPREPGCELTLDLGKQIAIEVPVAGACRVVEQPTVELDDDRQAVGDVSVDAARLANARDLTSTAREVVGTFDSGEVAVLQHRTGAFIDVAQHARHPPPTGESLTLLHRGQHSPRCRPARLDGL